MQTAHFSPEDRYNYGYGWAVDKKPFNHTQISHSGGYVGVLDFVTILPDDDIAILFFSNELDSELQTTRIEYLAISLINRALYSKAYQE